MLSKYLGMLHASEQQLADAFQEVADRHYNEFEIREYCKEMAGWSKGHLQKLAPIFKKTGEKKVDAPEMLRGSLFHGNRAGAAGLLQDLQDLSILAKGVHTNYIILKQAAEASKDLETEKIYTDFGDQTFRQIEWLTTEIKHRAPQTLNVPSNKVSEAKASVPKKFNFSAIPEPIFGPVSAAVLILIVGLISVATETPMLFPSLGPSAYLIGEMPAHPTSRWYNTILGHLIGLILGFVMVALFSAENDPSLLNDLTLTSGRMWAAVIAILFTVLIPMLLHASHPPAAATTLLVTLGAIKTITEGIYLMIGVIILALIGELLRQLRIGKMAISKGEPRYPSPGTNF
jgi:uncharacterized membrane protein